MFRNNNLTTRRETTDIWQSQNPVLNEMELGVEIILDTDRKPAYYNIKLGNGTTPWNNLDYFYENLDAEDTDEILDDFTINLATRKPAPNRIPIYNDNNTLKSAAPVEDDDVVRKIDVATIIDATDIPTAGKVAKYNNDAGLKSDKIPDENNDVIRKTDLDSHTSSTNAHGATDTPTASRIAMYNTDSGLKSGKPPTENNDVVRFLEFNDEVSNINSKISTLNGAYYVLDSYNFGKTLDETNPDDVLILNTYAIANTPSASSMADVYNDTVIVNEFDSAEYVYNKIAGVWVKYPNGYLTIATNDHLGVVKGTQPPADPTDESKDTYVQVLSDGTMKLVGDRLGKVNTVDGVAPNSDKNIELTIAMTKAEYAALEDPVGSGLYPSLKGKTVTLTDVYPDNIVRGMPDYDNQIVGVMPAPPSSVTNTYHSVEYTAPQDGYMYVGFYFQSSAGNRYAMFYVNGKNVIFRGNTNGQVRMYNKELVPIGKGQKFSYSINADTSGATITTDAFVCNFIPLVYRVEPAPRIVVEQGSDYSLTEQPVLIWDPVTQTSKPKLWIDGKPIYEKSVNISNPVNFVVGKVDLGVTIPDIDNVIDHILLAKGNSATIFKESTYFCIRELTMGILDNGNLGVYNNIAIEQMIANTMICTIWYTKTTD
jgi:hypothetical protein